MSCGRVAPEHEVLLHLRRREGPVTTAELVAETMAAGAPTHVVATLERLPEREWSSIDDAVAAIGTGRSARPD
jgi:hypothetical protein